MTLEKNALLWIHAAAPFDLRVQLPGEREKVARVHRKAVDSLASLLQD